MTTLEASYRACRKLNFRFGSTYYWAASLLPKDKRHHVHALYAFCRYADDIVDAEHYDGDRVTALNNFGERFFADLETGRSEDEILAAVVNSVRELGISTECFQRFMHSMEMDFTVSTYETFDDLMEYMDGSAAVIGEMMLPVLQPTSPKAFEAARNLGVAFQLTNFLRDVGEDLERGRIYIPQETLNRAGADPHTRVVTPEWRQAMQFEIARTRSIYQQADSGLLYLSGRSARCVSAARELYSGILDRIEDNDYDVFSQRARVSYWRKLAVLPRALSAERRSRRRNSFGTYGNSIP